MKRPDRRRNRLAGYDYRRDGLYFVTLCAHDRTDWFGRVADGVVLLNDIGTIADEQWQWLGQQYPYVDLGPYVIMPNHIHALIGIDNPVGNGLDRSANATDATSVNGGRVELRPYTVHSLSTLVGAFKTTSSKAIHLAGHDQFCWQKSFHDSIVRNDRSLARITRYIADNPAQWLDDSDSPVANRVPVTDGAQPQPATGSIA